MESPGVRDKQTTFAVGTGRCGTKFISEVLRHEPAVAASHERYPMAEAYMRYCRWYDLPVDGAGSLHTLRGGVSEDHEEHRVSFESSAYLSLHAQDLNRELGARLLLMVRRPDKVVNSFWGKGWYAKEFVQGDPSLALGFQGGSRPHHTFSRIAPRGAEFAEWQGQTRIGKLAWFWAALNEYVLDSFDALPDRDHMTVRLEDFGYDTYLDVARFAGFEPKTDADTYREISARKPNSRKWKRTVSDWTDRERREFEERVGPLAERLGYEYDTDRLAAEAAARPPAPPEANDEGFGRRWLRETPWLRPLRARLRSR